MLVANWKEVLAKSWTVWAAGIGLALPELLDLVSRNVESLPFTPEWKNYIRLAVLLAIPFVRIVQQKSLHDTPAAPAAKPVLSGDPE